MARRTAQRAAIRKVLEEAARPLSPAEILREAQALVPRLGLTTVYRTVNSLVEERWLQPVDLPGEAARYELSGKPHHHHFHCRKCDAVYDVPGCVRGLETLVPHGFDAAEHAIVLYGHCPACAEAPAAETEGLAQHA